VDERFFSDLVELSLDVVTVLGPEGAIIYESPSVEQMTGFAPEELVGLRITDIIHRDDAANTQATVDRVLAGSDREAIDFRFRHRDGSWHQAEAIGRRWLIDGQPHVLVNTRDVTEHRRMTAELARSNDFLEKTLGASRNVVSITRIDSGEFFYVNDEWLRAAGFRRDEVIGRTGTELGIWGSEAHRGRLLAALKAGGGRLRDHEIRTFTRNGERQFLVNVEYLSGEGASLTGDGEPMMLIVGSDVTDGRETEAQLRQAQKMEAVGQLTGGVAHDFNNLLAVIIGNAELLQEALRDQPELVELVEVILQAGERGAGVVEQLLSFSRRQLLSPRPVQLDATVDALVPLLRATLGSTIRLEIDLAQGLPPARVDPGQFENALLNLVVNARDALETGGSVRIELACREHASDLRSGEDVLPAGRYLELAVIDDGSGMEEAVLARAFDPFFTTKEPGRGTGLGLSMVFGFAHQSGGLARIDSGPGTGTRVSLLLPVHGSD
jgi:PAS domain S-box-containing protein